MEFRDRKYDDYEYGILYLIYECIRRQRHT